MYMYVCYLIQNVAVLYIATLMYVHTHVYCIYMCSTYSTGGSLESVPLLCQTANNHISVGMSACCTYVCTVHVRSYLTLRVYVGM